MYMCLYVTLDNQVHRDLDLTCVETLLWILRHLWSYYLSIVLFTLAKPLQPRTLWSGNKYVLIKMLKFTMHVLNSWIWKLSPLKLSCSCKCMVCVQCHVTWGHLDISSFAGWGSHILEKARPQLWQHVYGWWVGVAHLYQQITVQNSECGTYHKTSVHSINSRRLMHVLCTCICACVCEYACVCAFHSHTCILFQLYVGRSWISSRG